jgi:protoporphyrin/coproporphyrin ferrochelatase
VPAVRAYLAEFLSDPRVVELPRLLWLPLLHGVILRVRPARSARKYAAIWTPEGSPLLFHTERQAALLREATGLRVEPAMRYGAPGIAAAMERLQGCSEVTVVPLYPQYSASTTGSVLDVVGDRYRVIKDFHDHPAYIEALAANVRRHWEAHGRGGVLVMSFHGLPKRVVARGDPYEAQCQVTAHRLAQALGLRRDEWRLTFQSRFGPAAWLEPYTEPELQALARRGVERVDVVCPGFVADCLETLEEIGIGARAAFLAAGGRELQLVPCLNESPEWIAALSQIARA